MILPSSGSISDTSLTACSIWSGDVTSNCKIWTLFDPSLRSRAAPVPLESRHPANTTNPLKENFYLNVTAEEIKIMLIDMNN